MRRRSAAGLVGLACGLLAASALPAQQAPPPLDLAAVEREIASARLEPERAVRLQNLKLAAGLATLRFLDGILVPVSPVGGKVAEVVFIGKARITLEPPDEIEAGQLEIFTGSRRLDEEIREAVLVLGSDAATAAMLRRPPAAPLAAAERGRATAIYASWRAGTERERLRVEGLLVRKAAGDPAVDGYFLASLAGTELGAFLYVFDPERREQMTLGSFVPLAATERRMRKLQRELSSEHRSRKWGGLDAPDVGRLDTWLSASLRGPGGEPVPGVPSFEPLKYTLDLAIGDDGRQARGTARLELRPQIRGARAVELRLERGLRIEAVTAGDGVALPVHRAGPAATVVLSRVPTDGETVTLVVAYEGRLDVSDLWGEIRFLRNPLLWYPHAGTRDRASYDVTFHWPRRLDLVAGGRRIAAGEEADGRRWERRATDFPSAGFAFELGVFQQETVQAGHVAVSLAFDPESARMLTAIHGGVPVGSGAFMRQREAARKEILATVADALGYFEELYGPYHLDELAVATVERPPFSRATLGLVTVANDMTGDTEIDLGDQVLIGAREDRRTVVAREVARQWWGELVGWEGARDQWLGEAMANYSAMLYARSKPDWENRHAAGPTSGWREALAAETPAGLSVEAMGPLVLGRRLDSSLAGGAAYPAIVSKKGALVFDMLARSLGRDNFSQILRQIVGVTHHEVLSTEGFFSLVERISGTELDAFVDRFVYGTGLPEVSYTYRFEAGSGGKWKVIGRVRQQTPPHFRYRVVRTPAGFDVARERFERSPVASPALVVPLEIGLFDPAKVEGDGKPRKEEKSEPNASLVGHVLLTGAEETFELDVDHEPKELWLDRDALVFGRFFDERRHPRRALFLQGIDAAGAGEGAAAASLFDQALAAPAELGADGAASPSDRWRVQAAEDLEGRIQLGRSRLALDLGRDEDAAAALRRARASLGAAGSGNVELMCLEARLDLRRGAFEDVYRRLRNRRRTGVEGAEGQVLFAVAAHASGHREDAAAAREAAAQAGADLSALDDGAALDEPEAPRG